MNDIPLTFGQEALMWGVFFVVVPVLMILDLFVFTKKDHVIGLEESLKMSAWYVGFGLVFGLYIWWNMGDNHALDYYTAFVIEKSLSLDNLFVISVIFSTFAIPKEYQHRVLVWGIIGVIVMRGIMIGAGAAIVHQYHEVLLLFAAILIFTGIKMLMMKSHDDEVDDFANKGYIKFLKKHINFTTELHGHDFWVKKKVSETSEKMAWFATPLLLALVVVELTDLMFAFDSIPAVLAITTEPYVVYTSNIFAILGLRALFFAVENILDRFSQVKYALSAVLIFIGGKVFYNAYFPDITPTTSLLVTLGVLAAGFIFSMAKTRIEEKSKESQE